MTDQLDKINDLTQRIAGMEKQHATKHDEIKAIIKDEISRLDREYISYQRFLFVILPSIGALVGLYVYITPILVDAKINAISPKIDLLLYHMQQIDKHDGQNNDNGDKQG